MPLQRTTTAIPHGCTESILPKSTRTLHSRQRGFVAISDAVVGAVHQSCHGVVFAVLLSAAAPISASTFNVDNLGDFPDLNPGDGACANAGGFCTLRAAVMEGNALAGPHVVNLPAGTYTLSIASGANDLDAAVGDLDLTSNTWTFTGAGSETTVIDASAMNHRIFEIPVDLFFSGSVTFNDLTLQAGNSTALGSFNAGAAVRIGSRFASQILFNRVAVIGNTGSSAISTVANTAFESSTISNNSGTGVFQTNDGTQPTSNVRTLDISNSTIAANGGTGVAVGNNNGGSLVNSTVSGNGIHGLRAQFTNNRDFTITNSTIAENGQDGVAGIGFTIFDPVFGDTPVRPDLVVRNSVIADNARSDVTTPALDAQAKVPQSDGFNVVSDNSAAVNFTGPSDLNNTDPMLLPIALNAPGTTRTHALAPGSPAMDHASAAFAPGTDQRGIVRPQGAADDSGAYEFIPTVSDLAVSKSANVSEATRTDIVEFTVVVSNLGPDLANGAVFTDTPDANFTDLTWTCSAGAGASCTASGNGAINDLITLTAGGSATYTIQAAVASSAQGTAINTAAIDAAPGSSDPVPANNQDSASITIIVTNQPPTANDDTNSSDEDTSQVIDVAGNDTDVDGNLDQATANTACATCSLPANGLLTNNGDGTFDYTPAANFFGPDSFVYEICDTDIACDSATVDITVDPVNDAPSFTAGADPAFPAGTSGVQSIGNWPQNVDLGPNETQQVDSYAVTTLSDPGGILSGAAAISTAGELTFLLTGASGTAQFEATLTDDGGTPNGGDDTSSPVAFSITVADPAADLEASSLQCAPRAAPDEPYAYSFVITNNGPDDATGVAASHVPIPGAAVNSISSPDCVDTGSTVDCDLGTLAAGAGIQVGIEIQAPNVGAQVLQMTTSVVAATGDPSAGNNEDQASVEIVPGLIVVDGFEACTP